MGKNLFAKRFAVVTIALVCALCTVVFLAKGNNPIVTYAAEESPFGRLKEDEIILDTASGSGTFTMVPGHIYKIEIAGGAGQGASGHTGGLGAKLVGWVDMGTESAAKTFSYGVNSPAGGAAGNASGGSGGGGVTVKNSSNVAMMVAAGGGGAAAGSNGGNAGFGSSGGVNFSYDNGIVYKGGDATGTSHVGYGAGITGGSGSTSGNTLGKKGGNPGNGVGGAGGNAGSGGGGGGAGYAGGGGGSGGPGGSGSGGGGGGSSYVHSSMMPQSVYASNSGAAYIKVTQYMEYARATLSATDVTVTYDGDPHGIADLAITPSTVEDWVEYVHITYTGIGGTVYSATAEEPINPGIYSALIEFVGHPEYDAQSITRTVTIKRIDMADGETSVTVSLPYSSVAYTGTAFTPTPTVMDGSTSLVKDTDYIVSYVDNTNAGTASVIVTGIGKFTGSITKTFTITKIHITTINANLSGLSVTYDGYPHAIVVLSTGPVNITSGWVITYTGISPTEYSATTTAPTDAGKYNVDIVLENTNYYGSVLGLTMTINPKSIVGSTIIIPDQAYTGAALKPGFIVRDGMFTLEVGKDYEIDTVYGTDGWSNNVVPGIGTASVRIKGLGNYAAVSPGNTEIGNFTITKMNAVIVAENKMVRINGSPRDIIPTLTNGTTPLTLGIDYSLSDFEITYEGINETIYGPSSTAPGATVPGDIGEYNVIIVLKTTNALWRAEPITVKLEIIARTLGYDPFTDSEVAISIPSQVYTGTALTPTLVLIDEYDGYVLVLDLDYRIDDWFGNIHAGVASVMLTGIGEYCDTIEVFFTIEKAVLTVKANNAERQYMESNPAFTYTIISGLVDADSGLNFTFTFATTPSDTSTSSVGFYPLVITGIDSITDAALNTWEYNDYACVFLAGELMITPKLLDQPTRPAVWSFGHTGLTITFEPDGFSGTTMIISDDSATDIGEYTAIITLVDSINFGWVGGVSDVRISWSITMKTAQQDPQYLDVLSFGLYESDYNANTLLVDLNYLFTAKGLTGWAWRDGGTCPQVINGGYVAIYTPSDTGLYATIEVLVELTVNKQLFAKATINGNSAFIYNGSEQNLYLNNLVHSEMNITGVRETEMGTFTATVDLKDKNNCAWDDGETDAITFTWRIKGTITGITIDGTGTFDYDKENSHTVTVEGTKDGDTVTYSLDGENWLDEKPEITEIGEHTIYVKIQRDFCDDYVTGALITITGEDADTNYFFFLSLILLLVIIAELLIACWQTRRKAMRESESVQEHIKQTEQKGGKQQ